MILQVTFEKTTYAELPAKFEAGTPDINGAIGLGAAIDYVQGIGMQAIERYESELIAYAEKALSSLPSVRLIGRPKRRAAVLSFMLGDVHPHDVGTILDRFGIAIRAGHHCAQPAMRRMGVPGTARASFAFYNKPDEIDTLVSRLAETQKMFQP
jgi:cysteine desulfurase/selenocysteine lyase